MSAQPVFLPLYWDEPFVPTGVMARFPLELVLSILESAFFTECMMPDRNTLSACSRVCKDWRGPAQRLLFRYVTLHHSKKPLSLMKNFLGFSPRGTLLGSYVRSIDIRIGLSDFVSYPLIDFPRILSFFPRLYEVHLNSFEPEFDQETIHELSALARDNSLRPRCLKWFGPHPQSRMIYQLLSIWPSIQFLYIGNPLACEPPSERPDFSLYEIGYIAPPMTEVLEWLIPNHTVRVIYLQVNEVAKETTDLFIREGRYLRSVRLATYNQFSASLVARCPKLEELSIGTLLKESTDEMVDSLSPTIEHLRIREDPDSIQSILNFVRLLPRLRVVTLPTKTRTLTDVGELENECADKGVDIVYTSSAKNIKDDPVIVDRFPRGRSVSNFRLMN